MITIFLLFLLFVLVKFRKPVQNLLTPFRGFASYSKYLLKVGRNNINVAYYRGNLFYKGRHWKIRKFNKGFLHVLKRVRSDELNSNSTCRVVKGRHGHFRTRESSHRQGRSKRSADVKLLELFVVFSHDMYMKYLNKDKKNAVKFATEMTAHLDTIYKYDADVRIALVGVEVWETKDEVLMVTDAKELLDSFIKYGKNALKSFNFDLATLVTDVNFDYNIAGMAHVDVMCSPLSAAVIKHFPGAADPHLKSAVSLAHEIGHALGLVHDTDKCACADRTGKCIMAADTSLDPQSFSECSKNALAKMFQEGGASCLYDAPPHVYGGPVCGNGVKEQGEVCDCGNVIECLGDPCCMPGCKLKSGAQCNSGSCCKNCQIVQEGMICRSKQNECDLEEFCDGTRSECPANLHLPDMGNCGTSSSQGFCYKGKCRNAQSQCEYIWGPGAKAGHYGCYQGNGKGTISGNCGAKKSPGSITYKKCATKDLMCGMLQCDTKSTTPLIGNSPQFFKSMIHTETCISVAIDLGDDVPDPGLVDDGSPCTHFDPPNNEPGMCLSGKCVVLQSLPKTQCPRDRSGNECSLQGTCTNDGSCFCDDGYTGADCSQVGGVTRIRPTTTTPVPVTSPFSALYSGTSPTPRSSSPSAQKPTSPKPSSETPKELIVICGVVGGLTGLATLLFVLWRCKKPKSFWQWLEKRFPGKNATSPQKVVSTAWTKPEIKKPPTTPKGRGQGAAINAGAAMGISAAVGSHSYRPGHTQGHGHGHGHGRGNSSVKVNKVNVNTNHGNGNGRGHHSTSHYGSQESLETISLHQEVKRPSVEPPRW